MPETSEIIRALRKSHGLTQQQLAEIVGAKTYTTVTKWEKGENFPKVKELKKLCQHFKVSAQYLLGLKEFQEPPKAGNSADIFRQRVQGAIKEHEAIASIRNGLKTDGPEEEFFYVEAKGEEMEPAIPKGSFVLVQKQEDIHNSAIMLFAGIQESDVTLARVYRKKELVLLTFDNPKSPTLIFSADDELRVIGKAIEMIHFFP